MKHRLPLVCILLAGLFACGQSEDKTPPADNTGQMTEADGSTELTVTTADSLQETAWFTPSPDSGRAPLLVMLPMLRHTHESYFPFIDSLRNFFANDTLAEDKTFPHLLNFDLRGHGQSILKGGDSLVCDTMSDADFFKIPADVNTMLQKVLADYRDIVDTSRIIVVGASIGANAAILLTEMAPYIDKVVMLSPGLDYHSLTPSDAFRDFEGKTFIVTTRGDKYSHETVQRLAALKRKNWILKIYPRGGHGTDIINQYTIAMNDVIDWIFEEEKAEN